MCVWIWMSVEYWNVNLKALILLVITKSKVVSINSPTDMDWTLHIWDLLRNYHLSCQIFEFLIIFIFLCKWEVCENWSDWTNIWLTLISSNSCRSYILHGQTLEEMNTWGKGNTLFIFDMNPKCNDTFNQH